MKKSLLIKLHLYSGIFTSFYLIAFGLSAIILNHNINIEHSEITHKWETEIPIDSELQNSKLAENIRDQIGFMGWVPPWEYKRDSTHFKFKIVHTGRSYYLNANTSTGKVEISEAPKGFLAVFHGLHFFNGNIPNAPLLLRSWAIYQWLTLFVMAISLILGIWLWLKYSYKPWQGIVFGSLFIGTVIIMILI